MGGDPAKIRRSLDRDMDAFYEQGMFTNGLSTIQTDELHSYEEGIQVLGQSLLLDFGNPKAARAGDGDGGRARAHHRREQGRAPAHPDVVFQRHEDGARGRVGLAEAERRSSRSTRRSRWWTTTVRRG